MSIEKKTIRSDIPGHGNMLNSAAAYSATSAQDEGRRLIVGRDITLNGDISSCDHLVIEGNVNAHGFGARRLDVLEAGSFAGSAKLQDAVIAGRFEGKLIVTGRLSIKATGRLYGEIEYGTLECEAGARIEGQLLVIAQPVAEAQPLPAAPQVNDNVENMFGEEEAETGTETNYGRPRVFRRAVGY